MKYAIFYFSPCGGTKTVADIISRELGDAPMQELTTPSMNTAIDRDTLTFFCIPVYGGRIPKPMYDRARRARSCAVCARRRRYRHRS